MIEILVGLLVLPIAVGFFIATLFLPIFLILGGLLSGGLSIWQASQRLSDAWRDRRDVIFSGVQEPLAHNFQPLVDFRDHFPQLIRSEDTRHQLGPLLGRAEVGERLLLAERALSPRYHLKVVRCFDHEMLEGARQGFRQMRRVMDRRSVAWNRSMSADLDAYASGGSVDVILVGEYDEPVEMGQLRHSSEMAHEELDDIHSVEISPEIRQHRQALAAALASAGFVNHPGQWWHWSFGDAYWAAATHVPSAIFEAVNYVPSV